MPTSTREYCKCGGKGGYLLIDGELVCQSCGGLSPKAKLVGDKFVRIGENQIKCPKCGTVIQEARLELKIAEPTEDKMAGGTENKQIVSKGVKKISRR